MLDVTNETVLGNGYTMIYSDNPITFDGVTFWTLCPSGYNGCPNDLDNESTVTVFADVIAVKLSFSDKSNETIGNIFNEGSTNQSILSNHVGHRAGIFIEYVPPPQSLYSYRVFLLVQQ